MLPGGDDGDPVATGFQLIHQADRRDGSAVRLAICIYDDDNF
jgi:hypothetical protein